MQLSVGHEDDVAAAAAVSAVRTALGHEFLAPKAHAPRTALSGADGNAYLIDKHAVLLLFEITLVHVIGEFDRETGIHVYIVLDEEFVDVLRRFAPC